MSRADTTPPTASQTVGPFFPPHLIRPGANDLTRRRPGAPTAEGEPIHLSGRITQEGGRPIGNLIVEIWQADHYGRFLHPADRRNTPVDRNFAFWGRAATDAEGRYAFRTITPGAGPASPEDGVDAPHIAFTLLGSGLMRRLVTRMYFPDEPRNTHDPLLRSLADDTLRQRLCARLLDRPDASGAQSLVFDIVLRGPGETPFLAD
jgi:protocatechuate 3,4-dioxygenase beta subunit